MVKQDLYRVQFCKVHTELVNFCTDIPHNNLFMHHFGIQR